MSSSIELLAPKMVKKIDDLELGDDSNDLGKLRIETQPEDTPDLDNYSVNLIEEDGQYFSDYVLLTEYNLS